MSRLRRPLSRVAAALLVAAAIAGGVIAARALGALESAELALYDRTVRFHSGDRRDERVTLVAITEHDIQAQGVWPLPDAVLADALARLAALGPRAIGLDIYRDVPVPPGSERLAAVLGSDRRFVTVTKFGTGGAPTIAPPAVLKGTDQVGFNDIVVDPGGTVRRALLFLDDGTSALSAFALQLALRYLEPEGIALAPDPADETRVRLGRTTIAPLEGREGAYVAADARGYQFMLDFAGGPHRFATVTLGALLEGTADPALVRGRIVLLGTAAESVKDHFYTPLSAGLADDQQMAGMEVHARVASQLLRAALDGEVPLRSLPEGAEWAWIALWSLGGGLLGLRTGSPWRFAAMAVGGLLSLWAVTHGAFLLRWWAPVIPPALGWVVAAAAVTAYTSYRDATERGQIMKLFSTHVSREVAEAIWARREQFLDGNRPRPQQVVVTALFTDLTGFTTVSEKLGPEALIEWLNEYMDAMAQQVSHNGGVIRQYAGDSVVAMFGVPVARESEAEIRQDAINAVECGLAMERRLLELNRAWQAAGRPVTGMRIGIFTGPAVAGTLGSAERSEYVVVGDTMNTASRLESYDKELYAPDGFERPCRILIGETTALLLGDRYRTEWIGDVSLKGKEQTVGVYRLITRMGADAEAPAGGRLG
jgi:adenylate cyclase